MKKKLSSPQNKKTFCMYIALQLVVKRKEMRKNCILIYPKKVYKNTPLNLKERKRDHFFEM